jgi:hypothetical protein
MMEALKMETPMTEWNEDRLDELNGRVKDGFAKVDQEMKEGFAKVDREMKEGFAKVDRRFEKVAPREETLNAHAEVMFELRRLNDRFDRLLHTLMVIGWGFAGTVLAALIGAFAVLL